ncbi:arsenic resistance N-acetyltransferase ArsN2 [Natronoarchaeum mannanilyticum]|uniref:N-acetyltransferase domain-containing protein n=1 Tax=Natronoarchaeum mannanilyticum TaxID=926360 RepID=A0AAV3TDH4_9EURY
MATERLELRRAAEDLGYVERLLAENDLPTADVKSKPDCFYVGRACEEPIGVGGLERYGAEGLVRSLVVEESHRDRGWGTELYDALEAEAKAAGVEALYLLTTTAAEFFADRGFEEIGRAEAPPSIRDTAEFDELCPSSATCMRKRL